MMDKYGCSFDYARSEACKLTLAEMHVGKVSEKGAR